LPQEDDFLQAYDLLVGKIYGFLAYRVRSAADAEDLTQLTFERALRAWPRFDERKANATVWIMAIARNTLIDHQRRERLRNHPSLSAGEVKEADLPTHPGPDELPGPGPELAAALDRLRPREREAVALRFGADLQGSEIAEMLGISVDNVHQLLSRALRKLRDRLA
jgi:RNA polymerase sigma-70 factor (ECF subfamily)